ncbi:MAG: hypothetical protein PVF83_12455 [Anaerolineales bacterium]|jgi:hypothetical protein
MDEFEKLKTRSEPLHLQLVENVGPVMNTCACGNKIDGIYGLLCTGGSTPEDVVLPVSTLCTNCISKGPAAYIEQLQEKIRGLDQRKRDIQLIIKAVKEIPVEDWPDIPRLQ